MALAKSKISNKTRAVQGREPSKLQMRLRVIKGSPEMNFFRYSHRPFFSILALVLYTTLFQVVSAQAACVTGVRSNDVLNMRADATNRSSIIGAIRPGQCGVTIIERAGNWGYVRYRGREGWVNLRYIRESGGGGGSYTEACVVGVAYNDVLNIRSRPSGGSSVKGIIPPDRCGVRVYERRSRWSRISYRGIFGWVSNRYLREL